MSCSVVMPVYSDILLHFTLVSAAFCVNVGASGLKRASSTDVSLSGDEFTTYKKPLTDSTYTSPLANRYMIGISVACYCAGCQNSPYDLWAVQNRCGPFLHMLFYKLTEPVFCFC